MITRAYKLDYSLLPGNWPTLLDCGAFTAAAGNEYSPIDSYHRYIDNLPASINLVGYVSLDVIGDHAKTMRNLRHMRAAGYQPIPIIQPGFDPNDLDEIVYDAPDRYVALGGLRTDHSRMRKYRRYLEYVFSFKQIRNAKIHTFGSFDLPACLKYGVYSADVSSYLATRMHGWVFIYLPGRVPRIVASKRANRRSISLPRPHAQCLRTLHLIGVPVKDFLEDNHSTYNTPLMNTTYMSWFLYQRACERLGVRIYLSGIGGNKDIGLLRTMFRSLCKTRAWREGY